MVGTKNSMKEENTNPWGTWEELLLGFAVERHGSNKWSSVSMELQLKTSLHPSVTTPVQCKLKFEALNLRFQNLTINDEGDDRKQKRKEKKKQPQKNRIPWLEELRKLRMAELNSDLQHRDRNIKLLEAKVKKLQEEEEKENEEKKKADLETGESKTDERKDVKDGGGDLQGSATSKKKEEEKGGVRDYDDDELMKKLQPLVDLLEKIGAHKHASFFQHRLPIQKWKRYKTVRQHMDLDTIKLNLRNGAYSSSPLAFYRDLLLVFTNAVVFFPKDSTEYVAATELRSLVLKEKERSKISARAGEQKHKENSSSTATKKLDNMKKKSMAGFLERINNTSPIKGPAAASKTEELTKGANKEEETKGNEEEQETEAELELEQDVIKRSDDKKKTKRKEKGKKPKKRTGK